MNRRAFALAALGVLLGRAGAIAAPAPIPDGFYLVVDDNGPTDAPTITLPDTVGGDLPLVLLRTPLLATDFDRVEVKQNAVGVFDVVLRLSAASRSQFKAISGQFAERRIAIVVKAAVRVAPVLHGPISDGVLRITLGRTDPAWAEALAARLHPGVSQSKLNRGALLARSGAPP